MDYTKFYYGVIRGREFGYEEEFHSLRYVYKRSQGTRLGYSLLRKPYYKRLVLI